MESQSIRTKPGRRSFRLTGDETLDFVAMGRCQTMEMAAHLTRKMFKGGHSASSNAVRDLCPNGTQEEYELLMNMVTEDNDLRSERRRQHNIRPHKNVYYRSYMMRNKGLLMACLRVSNCVHGYMKKYECLSKVKFVPSSNFGSMTIAPSNRKDQRRLISINGLNKNEFYLNDPTKLIKVEEDKGNIYISVLLNSGKGAPTTEFKVSTAKNRRLYIIEHGYFTTNPIEQWGNTKYVTDSEFEFLWRLKPQDIYDVGYSIEYKHPTFGISKIHLNSSPRCR